MKTIKTGNTGRLIAILILAIVIVLVVGVAVSGWSAPPEEENKSPEPDKNESESQDKDGNDAEATVPEEKIPEYINYLTGLETDIDKYTKKPFAFITSSISPLYGIASADIVIEIPCEGSETRFLVYNSSVEELGKLGALLPTRDYISALTCAFGGILCADGNDDIVDYHTLPSTLHLDISKFNDKYYTENAKYIYSSGKLITELAKEEEIDTAIVKRPILPFNFADFGEQISGITKAESINISYGNKSTLNYDGQSGLYYLSKNETEKTDMLTGEKIGFKNVFILFADTTTYEKSTGVEVVTDTTASGAGYYATNGKLTEIRWHTNEAGELVFETLGGERLTVNRGNSYIGFYKSSCSEGVTFN